ncbi:hypothetical protein AJ79_09723 [Helicocarpus griseus UAMH5409]|uniref:Uncharacterized protein n=1 Tax=Helicocarpus griseus UAMH5409 TaxID=1447875 RepID=A0A2B7WHM7_9EURO|nr:hypothetical protein AJ79_09723 [Helicocarpus griseus UAMH5409]
MRIPFISLLLGATCVSGLVAREPKNAKQSPKDVCGIRSNKDNLNSKDLAHIWTKSGAAGFLKNFLKKHGTDEWTEKFFKKTVNGGKQSIATFNCMAFPGGTTCTTPGNGECVKYKPPEAFYVHQQIASLWSAFDQIHEATQTTMVNALLADIQDAVDIFGPPKKKDDGLWALMIGAFVGGAGLAGPVWQVAAPLTAVVGALNIAAGMDEKSAKPKEPDDFKKLTSKDVKRFFDGINGSLNKTVDAVFGGKFKGVKTPKDKVKWITDQFAGGKLLDLERVGSDVEKYTAGVAKLVKQGMVVSCLKANEYYVSQRHDITKEKCAKRKRSVWMNNRCTSITKQQGAAMTGKMPTVISEKLYKAFTKDYKFDYKKALQNAVNCAAKKGSAGPDWSKLPAFGKEEWPECFFNLPVKEEDFYGEHHKPDTPNPKKPWTGGQCGIHIIQYQKNQKAHKTGKDFQFDIEVFDGRQKSMGGVKKKKAPNGKKFNVKSKLPHLVVVTAHAFDDSAIDFAYAGAKWNSKQKKLCKMGKYDNGRRQGDCGFPC